MLLGRVEHLKDVCYVHAPYISLRLLDGGFLDWDNIEVTILPNSVDQEAYAIEVLNVEVDAYIRACDYHSVSVGVSPFER